MNPQVSRMNRRIHVFIAVIGIGLWSEWSRGDSPPPVGGKLTPRDFITCIGESGGGTSAERQGNKVLRDSYHAYAGLQSFVATDSVDSVTDFPDGPLRQTFQLKVQFQKPGKVRMEGPLKHGGKLLIL